MTRNTPISAVLSSLIIFSLLFSVFPTTQTYAADSAPAVLSTTPADAGVDVALGANLEITFSEPVDVSAGWFEISCVSSEVHTAVVSGGPEIFTLDPEVDFAYSESCTVTVLAALVADQDTDDPPDHMDADYGFSFNTAAEAIEPAPEPEPTPPAAEVAEVTEVAEVAEVNTDLIINEVDADTPGDDVREFIELYDGGVGNTVLDGLVVVLFNGSDDLSYTPAFDLDGFSTDPNGYFVIGTIEGADLYVAPTTYGWLQNGADAVALLVGDAVDFPNDTPLTTAGLLDAIVYDTSDSDDAGLLTLLNAGQPQVNEGGSGDKDNHSNQRCPDGTGGQLNTDTYSQFAPTPGGQNICEIVIPIADFMIINEVDADTPGDDVLEFIELYDGGVGNTVLDGLVVVLYNGSDDLSYTPAFDLDGFSTDPDGYFVIGSVAGADIDVAPGSSGWLQNGADAVALLVGDAVDFPNDTPLPTAGLLDAIVYDTSDSDDAVLLTLLNAGQPQINENGAGDKDNHSNQRCPNGAGGQLNTDSYAQFAPTPGEQNGCAGPPPVADFMIINEVDSDTPSYDTAEFIELYDGGSGNTDLTGLVLVFYNGSGDLSYRAIDLDGSTTDNDGYFVLCGNAANVANCDLDASPDQDLIQNGADAVALYIGDALDFPNDTPLTAAGLLDAIVYDTNDGDDAALLVLLNAGQPQVNEDGGGDKDNQSNQRCPNGSGGQLNTDTYTQSDPTPGVENNCPVVVPELVINEFSASTTGTDVEYIEVFGTPNTDFSDFVILEIEGGFGANLGVVDEVVSLGTTDPDGFYLINLPANALENDTITLLLVQNFTGVFGEDLDLDDDGVLDNMPWDALIDAVAVNDGTTGDLTYGIPVLGRNYDGVSSYAPGGASRIPDGFDTDAAADWVRNDFDLAGIPGESGTLVPGEALNTPGTFNEVYVAPPEACGDAYTPIYDIQGSGLASLMDGSEVSTEGIVVGDFQDGLYGYYIQDAAGDGDASTSDGIFVYDSDPDVNVGDHVRVRGFVDEYYDLTEITGVSQVWVCSTGGSVAPSPLSLPLTAAADLEPYEGMLVSFAQPLFISEYYNYGRYGEIVLATERQFQPTAIYEPGSAEADQLLADNLLARIKLDDGRSSQNPDPALHPNGGIFDLTNLFRGGDVLNNLTGVVDYNYGEYKIQPTMGADYVASNPRTAQPDYVGELNVASFNVLNYFTTLGSRGADTAEEFERQRAKIFAALAAMDADVVGLIEIENNSEAIQDLVDGLNLIVGAGTYAYVDTGVIGTDEIKVAFIYKTATASLVGDYAVLDSSVDPTFIDTKNRPSLAQTFRDEATGGVFTVVVNHFKSKGSSCDDIGDPDTGDGSGNCNLTRLAAAEALVNWLATDPTGSGDADFMIIGDLNSYDKEDPIDAIVAGGYSDLVFQYIGEDAYSYVFDGQLGYLDHALALGSSAMSGEISGATVWHINADEPSLIDYDMTFKADAQDALYAPDPYRSSDHDPVIIGLDVCDEIAPTLEIELSKDTLWPANHKMVEITATVTASDNFDLDPVVTLLSITSSELDDEPGDGDGSTVDDILILDDFNFLLRAERSATNKTGRIYLITYQVEDACGNTTTSYATVTVPFSQKKK